MGVTGFVLAYCGLLLNPSVEYAATPTVQSEPSATSSVAMQAAQAYFPLGVFEDGNMINGGTQGFRHMLRDLQAHGLDSVMFTNNFIDRDAPLLAVSDELQMNVFMLPSGELNEVWWPDHIPADSEIARALAEPIVRQFGAHPSFKGYLVKDEPLAEHTPKVALLTQALRERDPTRPVLSILIGTDRVEPIFQAVQPDVMLIDVYPTGYHNPPCDFTLSGFGYDNIDFVNYIRLTTRQKPANVPLWIILQTHKLGDGGVFSLREPSVAEVRMQHWLAIGEGATGIFWFIYSSQQGWTGLADNPALYAEVTDLAQRIHPLRDRLLGLQRGTDRFSVTGSQSAVYVSTLVHKTGTGVYVVAVNQDCERAQDLTISSATLQGQLRDVESRQIYDLETPIPFRPGDGRIFELVSESTKPIDDLRPIVPSITPHVPIAEPTELIGTPAQGTPTLTIHVPIIRSSP